MDKLPLLIPGVNTYSESTHLEGYETPFIQRPTDFHEEPVEKPARWIEKERLTRLREKELAISTQEEVRLRNDGEELARSKEEARLREETARLTEEEKLARWRERSLQKQVIRKEKLKLQKRLQKAESELQNINHRLQSQSGVGDTGYGSPSPQCTRLERTEEAIQPNKYSFEKIHQVLGLPHPWAIPRESEIEEGVKPDTFEEEFDSGGVQSTPEDSHSIGKTSATITEPTVMLSDVPIFIAIDFEYYAGYNRSPSGMRHRMQRITELGIAMLDTRDLYNNHHTHVNDLITTQHYRTGPQKKEFREFRFGASIEVEESHLIDILKHLLHLENNDEPRKAILVCQGFPAENEILRGLGIDLWQIPSVIGIVDTYLLARDIFGFEGFRATLSNIVNRVGIDCSDGWSHNAGNDANLTLRAMLSLATDCYDTSKMTGIGRTRVEVIRKIAEDFSQWNEIERSRTEILIEKIKDRHAGISLLEASLTFDPTDMDIEDNSSGLVFRNGSIRSKAEAFLCISKKRIGEDSGSQLASKRGKR